MIGYTWESKKGSVLKVIDIFKNEDTKRWMYTVECSICSQDKELYPSPLVIEKYSARRGSAPCGCALIPSWTEYQYKVRIDRVCKAKGYVLEGFVGDKIGNGTYLKLYNPISGNKWESCTARNLLKGRGDPTIRVEKVKDYFLNKRGGEVSSILEKHPMRSYMSNISWYLSPKSGEAKVMVRFDCTNCKTVNNTAYTCNMSKGKISCKCKIQPSIFKDKLSRQDNLYIMKDVETDNIKIGRSFNLEDRVRGINNNYKGSWEILLHIKGKHQYISDLEQEVLFIFSEFKIEGNTNEILLGTSLDKVINFLKEVKGEVLYYQTIKETL